MLNLELFMKLTKRSLLLLILMGTLFPLTVFPSDFFSQFESDGKGEFIFNDWDGVSLRVYSTMPKKISNDTPIVIILHGQSRNAEGYRNSWHGSARDNNFISLVPKFSTPDFPKTRYNLGNMKTLSGRSIEREKWIFSAIEPLFEYAREMFGTSVEEYSLFGHSAGAQVAHRFLYFIHPNRASRTVLANSGYYTMPIEEISYPYGLKGVKVSEEMLTNAYNKRVIVLLGDKDNDPKHSSLNTGDQARRQGAHRFARGHNFYMNSLFKGSVLMKVPFNWSMSIAPGVGHSNRSMVPFATPFLLDGPLKVR